MAAERYLLCSISIQLIAEWGINGALLHREALHAGLDLKQRIYLQTSLKTNSLL